MTTKAAENLYLAQHLYAFEGKRNAIYNPENKNLSELPIIYGFNNGGSPGWWHGVLLTQDGKHIGGHICSHEGYMPHDLGILEGSRPDRHEDFKKHYPNGYKMEFVGFNEKIDHLGLKEAEKLYDISERERLEK